MDQKLESVSVNKTGDLEVREELSGPGVMEVYECEYYVHSILVKRNKVPLVAAVLGNQKDDITEVVFNKLRDEDYYLADLMDLLDSKLIAYAYTAQVDGVVHFRP
ncbi:hypothetical protein [Atopobium fossor]|uniref:hypothetical protein n=1 Tax=Atopobium fossor TaxID=39487 RepID=UPI000425BE78|nr:hypothetical protein [Atopobium fossor]